MKCEWIEFGNIYKCKNCGFEVRINTLNKVCSAYPRPEVIKSPPNIIKRGMNFGKAAVNHVMTGAHHCTNEEKQQRFHICQSNECGLFQVHGEGGICSHDDCGCYIRSNGKFMDKLSWAESKCPVGKWGPIEQKTQESPENGV